ncbi:MAG: iron-containing alcohol dehydrogenase family protein, partial [Firmicutes bacterium]|nr:iron-containing alcohol dehydrogenase family protein [Bacillota bacterium]
MLKRTVGPPVYVRGCDVLALAGEYTAPLGKRV